MLKYALLGAAMALTGPAFAQTTPAADPAPAAPAQTTTTDAAPAADVATPAAAEPAAAPAAPDQIAQVVDQQFATYDKDGNGKLNEPEFAAWMVALKSQSDSKTDANAPATKKWNQAAFAQADKDKSKSLTKAELTGFLTSAKS